MLKTHHKMRGWNREIHYLSAKIIGKIVKYQYLPAKTIRFSLSHLTLSSLSHIPLSPLFSWLWFQNSPDSHRSSTADGPSPSQSQSVHQCDRDPYIQNSKTQFSTIFHYFLNSGETTLAADFITAWKPLQEDWKLHRKLGTTLWQLFFMSLRTRASCFGLLTVIRKKSKWK